MLVLFFTNDLIFSKIKLQLHVLSKTSPFNYCAHISLRFVLFGHVILVYEKNKEKRLKCIHFGVKCILGILLYNILYHYLILVYLLRNTFKTHKYPILKITQ